MTANRRRWLRRGLMVVLGVSVALWSAARYRAQQAQASSACKQATFGAEFLATAAAGAALIPGLEPAAPILFAASLSERAQESADCPDGWINTWAGPGAFTPASADTVDVPSPFYSPIDADVYEFCNENAQWDFTVQDCLNVFQSVGS